MPLLSFPKPFLKRFLVVLVLFTSMTYSINLIVSILRTLVQYDELTFNSMGEIIQSDCKVVMDAILEETLFNSEDENTRKLLSKKKILKRKDFYPGPEMKNKKIISIIISKIIIKAKYAFEKLVKSDAQIYRIIPVKFGCDVPGYAFERASPFVCQFEFIFMRMYESGIYNMILKGDGNEISVN